MFATAKQPSLLRCGALCVGEGTMQLSCSSLAPLSNKLSSETEFLPLRQLPKSTVNSESQFPIQSASPAWSTTSPRVLTVWLVWMTISLIPWFFHAVWFSGTSGCLLILDWLLSSFWLCEEMKGFYLCFHLGWNSKIFFKNYFKKSAEYIERSNWVY